MIIVDQHISLTILRKYLNTKNNTEINYYITYGCGKLIADIKELIWSLI